MWALSFAFCFCPTQLQKTSTILLEGKGAVCSGNLQKNDVMQGTLYLQISFHRNQLLYRNRCETSKKKKNTCHHSFLLEVGLNCCKKFFQHMSPGMVLRAEVDHTDWKLRMNMKEEWDRERGVNLRPGTGIGWFRKAVRVQCASQTYFCTWLA